MNDFDYDCLQKKRVAQSAKNRVGQRKGCKTPSDFLTEAERNKLNGEVVTVNLNKPMDYRYFKLLPKTLQEEYCNHLMDKFGATKADIARMMGAHPKVFDNFVKVRGLDIRKTTRGSRLQEPVKWKEFCENGQNDIDEKSAASSEPVEPCTVDDDAGYSQNFRKSVVRYFLEFSDINDWADIFAMLSKMPLPENGHVHIVVDDGSLPNVMGGVPNVGK